LDSSCDGTHVWRRVAVNLLPGCRPSRRSNAVPRRMGLLGRSCP
jgi:hypothetical protein